MSTEKRGSKRSKTSNDYPQTSDACSQTNLNDKDVEFESEQPRHFVGMDKAKMVPSLLNNSPENKYQRLFDIMDQHLSLQKEKIAILKEKVAFKKQKVYLDILETKTDDLEGGDLLAVLAIKKLVRDIYL